MRKGKALGKLVPFGSRVCSDSDCPRKPQKQTEPLSTMALFGYARVSMREPEDKSLDLVVEGDALVVTHIYRLFRD